MIALVGSGEYLAPMADVDLELLSLVGATPRVVCLPTAAGREGDTKVNDWMQRGVRHFNELGADAQGVGVRDRNSANDADLAGQVAAADVVYLSGGSPAYLHETLRSTLVWQTILEVIGRGGLLVGCSAGAMVQGEQFMGGLRPRSGFGLWPGVYVIPHFDEIPQVMVAAIRRMVGRQHIVVGVNANTALLRTGSADRVLGDEVTIWTSTGRSTHAAGELPPGSLPADPPTG